MKLRLVILAGAFALLALPAHASEVTVERFRSEIDVRTDASIAVTETIVTRFDVPRHGIYRTLPYNYTDRTTSVNLPFRILGATMDGRSVPLKSTNNGTSLVIRLGDARKTITGQHTYVLRYEAKAVINFFASRDELYWNVSGTNWDMPIEQFEAIVRLPAETQNFQWTCYTGAYGSTDQDCTADGADGVATFSSSRFMTIVVGFPKGLVVKPADYDTLRQAGTKGDGLVAPTTRYIGLIAVNVLAVLVVILWLFWWWERHGRDPKQPSTLVVQYDPPDQLRPGEVGTLYDDQVQTRDVSSTIVDLAVRGYLRIEELRGDQFLGLLHNKDYQLVRRRSADAALRTYERTLHEALFKQGETVRLSKLKGKFAADLKKVQNQLYQQVFERGYYTRNPNTIRTIFLVVGIIVIAIPASIPYLLIFPSLFVVGLAFIIAARFMPQRTTAGAAATWHARGFKEYLERAEQYRLKWQEREHIFEHFLPYAMVFGVASKWSKAFADLDRPARDWYVGTPGTTFNSLVLASALTSFTVSAGQALATPAAQGVSGFGGGGFSGGGFGGGGGGSW